MKVWSPRAGVPISIKLEDADSPPDANGNPSVIAEIIMTTNTFNEWGTLTFDFSQDAANYSVDNEYDRIVIFPDIGTVGVTVGKVFILMISCQELFSLPCPLYH